MAITCLLLLECLALGGGVLFRASVFFHVPFKVHTVSGLRNEHFI